MNKQEIINALHFLAQKIKKTDFTLQSSFGHNLKNKKLYNRVKKKFPQLFLTIGEFGFFLGHLDTLDSYIKLLFCPVCGINRNSYTRKNAVPYTRTCSQHCAQKDPSKPNERANLKFSSPTAVVR